MKNSEAIREMRERLDKRQGTDAATVEDLKEALYMVGLQAHQIKELQDQIQAMVQ